MSYFNHAVALVDLYPDNIAHLVGQKMLTIVKLKYQYRLRRGRLLRITMNNCECPVMAIDFAYHRFHPFARQRRF